MSDDEFLSLDSIDLGTPVTSPTKAHFVSNTATPVKASSASSPATPAAAPKPTSSEDGFSLADLEESHGHVGGQGGAKITKPILQDPKKATYCAQCTRGFGMFLWPHNCYGCGRVFCDACCDDWLLLPYEFGHNKPKRVCRPCLKQHMQIDLTKPYDVAGPAENGTIILLAGSMATRAAMYYPFQALSPHFQVVCLDLPGLGARDGEKLTKQSAFDVITEAIQKFSKNGKALLVGHSMGGFVALQFGSEHPELTAGLVLSGCASESSGVGSAALYGAMGAVYKVTPKSKQWTLIPSAFPSIPKDKLERSFLRAPVNYKQWNACSQLLQEPYQNYYLMCLTTYEGPVLFLTGEKDFRTSEDKFLLACKKGEKFIIRGGTHFAYLEDGCEAEWTEQVIKFAKKTFV